MMFNRALFAGTVLSCPGLCGGQILAQHASLQGTVTDPGGGVVPGADVTLSNQASGAHRHTISDETGRYLFVQIGPGMYTIGAALDGFKTYLEQDVPPSG